MRNGKEFDQQIVDAALLADLQKLVRMAIEEDLGPIGDVTTQATVPLELDGAASIVARESGTAAGFALIDAILDCFDSDVTAECFIEDGQSFESGSVLATLRGSTRNLLVAERTVLNFLGKLCGIATLASRFVERVHGTSAQVYDTRKTTPGYRRLEKYASRCGGATNHRSGLWQAVLIKDNHLAGRAKITGELLPAGEAVRLGQSFIRDGEDVPAETIVEIEVDTLEQLRAALPAKPDIVLLDNMSNEQLREAVSIRDAEASWTELEASGGVNLDTIQEIAKTGVERISVGAITHSAINLDLGLDWIFGEN